MQKYTWNTNILWWWGVRVRGVGSREDRTWLWVRVGSRDTIFQENFWIFILMISWVWGGQKGMVGKERGYCVIWMDFCKKQPTVVVVHFTIAKYYITRILGPLRGPTSSWIQDTRRNTVKELWRNTASKKCHWEIQKKSLRNFKKICILVLKSFFLPKIVSEFVGHFDTSRFPTALR